MYQSYESFVEFVQMVCESDECFEIVGTNTVDDEVQERNAGHASLRSFLRTSRWGFETCKVKTSKPYVVSIFLRYLG